MLVRERKRRQSMRKGLLFVVLVVSVLSFVIAIGASEVSVEVFFVSPGVDYVIESRIIESIDNATSQILIAMYA